MCWKKSVNDQHYNLNDLLQKLKLPSSVQLSKKHNVIQWTCLFINKFLNLSVLQSILMKVSQILSLKNSNKSPKSNDSSLKCPEKKVEQRKTLKCVSNSEELNTLFVKN